MLQIAGRIVRLVIAALFVSAAALWPRSYRAADVILLPGQPATLNGVGSCRGRVVLFGSDLPFDPRRQWGVQAWSVPSEQLQPAFDAAFADGATLTWSAGGFRLGRGLIAYGGLVPPPAFSAAAVPHWFIVLLTGVPSMLWMRNAVRRWRWGRQGRCRSCGYDLRSTPERCPECGERAPRRAKSAVAATAALLPPLLLAIPAHAETATEKRIESLDLSHATLEQGFDKLRDSTHANIVVHWPALEAAGYPRDNVVKLRLWDVSLGTALTVLLDACGDPLQPLGWSEDEQNIITVSTKEEAEHLTTTVVYDIRDLLAAIRASTMAETPEEERATRQEIVDEVTRLITEAIDPETWRDAGGRQGGMRELGGRLIITQSPANQEMIRRLLTDLRREFAKPPATLPAFGKGDDGRAAPGRTRFYDVRDLVAGIRADSGDKPGPGSWFEAGAQLLGSVRDNVEPQTWGDTAKAGHVTMVGGRLVVTQTPEVHALIERFLAEYRREIVRGGKGAAGP